MSAWTETTLGEACELYQPQTISSAELVEDGSYPVYGANGIIGRHDKFNHEESQLLVTCRGATCGTVNISQPYAWINGNAMVVRPRNNSLNLKYLAHLFRGGIDLTAAITGAAQPQITRQSLAPLRIRIPTLPEQHRIAAILDQAETLRTQRRTALALLDSLTQSLFLDMFGDPVTNPKKLPLFRGDEICSRITVGIVVQPSSYYRSEGVPALRSLNIRPNKVVMENLVYFSSEDNETKLAKTKVRQGDVLLVRTGQPGTAAVVPPELDGVNAIDILIATPDTSKVSADYLCYFFNSDAGKRLVLGAQRGQVQKHLNVGAMNAALIPVPPLPLQQTFATRIASIEALKATHRRALAALDALFASLQQRAFSGELTPAAPRAPAQSLAQLQQLEASIGQEALIFIAKRMPDGDLYNSLKAIYFADRHHLEHHGRQIYNETYSALDHGPVPQAAYDATKVLIGKLMFSSFDDDVVRAALRRNGGTLTALRDADFSKLSRIVIESLEWGIRYCRDMKFGQTKTASHDSAYERTPKNEAIPLQYIIDTLPPEARQRHWNL